MIPRELGHIWVGVFPAPDMWMKTWKDKHPDWSYTLYDNDFLLSRRFICQKQIIEFYKRGMFAGVSDLMRYEILYEKGGFLPEADSVCVNPVDELFSEEKCYTVYEFPEGRKGLVSPFLASNPGNPVLKKVLDTLSKLETGEMKRPWDTVGNGFLRRFFKRHKFEKDLTIFPSHYFIPEHNNGEKYQGDDKIYAHQLWGTTSKSYPHSNGKHGLSREEIQEKIAVTLKGLQLNLTN